MSLYSMATQILLCHSLKGTLIEHISSCVNQVPILLRFLHFLEMSFTVHQSHSPELRAAFLSGRVF